jgi:hypothetical protein
MIPDVVSGVGWYRSVTYILNGIVKLASMMPEARPIDEVHLN